MDNRIKLLHIIRPADGGMKEHLVSLVKHLDSRIFDISVACPHTSSIIEDLEKHGTKTLPIDIVGEINPLKDLKAISQLKSYFVEAKPHIIHAHGAKAGYLGRIAGIMARTPRMVLTVHNFVLENRMSSFKRTLFKRVDKALAGYTDSIITVSDALKEHLIKAYQIDNRKITTIYNGLNLEAFKQKSDFNFELSSELGHVVNSNPVIGVIARLAPQKGVNYFLLAAKIVVNSWPQAKFLVVGDGPERKSLEALKSHLNLDSTVFFLGERKNVYQILKGLDIFVLPSISEGLSITTIEAMAAGCPVVASRVGGVPEIVQDGENGILVEPQNPKAMAEGIMTLLSDREFSKKLSETGFKQAEEKFSLEKMIENTHKLYLSLI